MDDLLAEAERRDLAHVKLEEFLVRLLKLSSHSSASPPPASGSGSTLETSLILTCVLQDIIADIREAGWAVHKVRENERISDMVGGGGWRRKEGSVRSSGPPSCLREGRPEQGHGGQQNGERGRRRKGRLCLLRNFAWPASSCVNNSTLTSNGWVLKVITFSQNLYNSGARAVQVHVRK